MKINTAARLSGQQSLTAAIDRATHKKFLLALRKNSEFFSTWTLEDELYLCLMRSKVMGDNFVFQGAKEALKALGWKLVMRKDKFSYFTRDNEWTVSLYHGFRRVHVRLVTDQETITELSKAGKIRKQK